MGTYTMIGLRGDDVIYCHLPLYHSSGGQIAISGSLFFGTKTVIKKKFSASAFWKDCIAHRVTATQHIGEIARFLLARPPAPEDKRHNIRIIFGNGLKPELWTNFVEVSKSRNKVIRIIYLLLI
jgi:solute carrier family 27 fatty acid transporter 1/4